MVENDRQQLEAARDFFPQTRRIRQTKMRTMLIMTRIIRWRAHLRTRGACGSASALMGELARAARLEELKRKRGERRKRRGSEQKRSKCFETGSQQTC